MSASIADTWPAPRSDAAQLRAGQWCPADAPLLCVRRHTPAALLPPPPERCPPGESAGGGTQRAAPPSRCAAHGNDLCVPRLAAPPTLLELCVRTLAANSERLVHLPRMRRPLSAGALNALVAAVPLDARTLCLLLPAGATQLHIDDFSGLLAQPFAPGWRLWRADACLGPPPEGDHFAIVTLPPWLAVLDDDGALVPAPAAQGWLRLMASAPALHALALENGAEEDADVAAAALHAALGRLRAAPALRRLALGFFDGAPDEALRPLLALRRLERLELSHLPQLSDAMLRDACTALSSLTHLRLDYLAVGDAGLSRLDRLKALTWLELRACPYVQFGFAFPFGVLSRLHTLRLDPPGGDARMRVSSAVAARIAAACIGLEALTLGLRPAPPRQQLNAASMRGARAPAPAPEQPFFDMQVLNGMPRRLQSLEIYSTAHVTWPRGARAWPAAARVHTLVLDVPSDWLLSRLRQLPALRSLTVCDCSGLSVEHLDGIALAEGLTRLVLGRVPVELLRYTRRLLRWLPRCAEAHFHTDCLETPCQSSFFA